MCRNKGTNLWVADLSSVRVVLSRKNVGGDVGELKDILAELGKPWGFLWGS